MTVRVRDNYFAERNPVLHLIKALLRCYKGNSNQVYVILFSHLAFFPGYTE